MPISGSALIVGAVILFGLPLGVVMLNRRKRNAGWWLLLGVVAFMIVGNVIEKAVTG